MIDRRDEMLCTKQIAALWGLCHRHVTDRLVKRPDFPRPAVNLNQKTRRWRRSDLERFATQRNPTP